MSICLDQNQKITERFYMKRNKLLTLFCAAMGCFFSACNGFSLSAGDFNASSDIGAPHVAAGHEESAYRFDGTKGWPKDEAVVAVKGKAESGALMLPNPFISCDSVEEAARLAGFKVVLPKVPDKLEVVKGTMIQAFYGENGKDMLIRKARGDADISGDYNHYAQVESTDKITLKGKKDVFFLAVWARDGYAFSISVAQGLSRADLLVLVAAVR